MEGNRDGAGSRRSRPVLLLLVCACAAAAGAVYWHWSPGLQPARAVPASRPAVPVKIAVAARQDVPIIVTGLGTVQASFTIAIHTQVEGIMQQVLFTEGQHVKKGDLLARIDPRLYQAALDQAKAKKSQDTATLIGAEKDLVRSKTLVVRNVATEQTVDQQQARVDQLKASIEADQAAIETAQTQFDYTFIKAPSDGRIGVRLVDPGNLVHASDTRPIASLVLTQPSAVMFTLPMQVLDDLREAMARGPVEVQAYDQNDRRLLSTGKLLLIDNAIDQATATIRLKAMFANEDERLWPGEFVNARVLIDTRHDVIAVPTTAIQRGANGLFVWIVNADSVVESRPVMVGPASGDLTVIEKGIDEGERVVTDGQYKLQVNARVNAGAPAAPAGAAK
jgi:multidrug efflux system membrane fusion protein